MLKRGNSRLKSTKPLKRGGGIKSGKSVKKVGKRGAERKEINNKLFDFFAEKGIISCEANLEGCLKNSYLTFAHSKKSRKIHTQEDWLEVGLLCVECHSQIEGWKADDMLSFIQEIISKRGK